MMMTMMMTMLSDVKKMSVLMELMDSVAEMKNNPWRWWLHYEKEIQSIQTTTKLRWLQTKDDDDDEILPLPPCFLQILL